MKWRPEEKLRLYIFVMYNFKYIMVVKFRKQLEDLLEIDDNGKIVGVNLKRLRSTIQLYEETGPSGRSTPSDLPYDGECGGEELGKAPEPRKKKRANQLNKQFYEAMTLYFNEPKGIERDRKLLRCKTNKMFHESASGASKQARWNNNQIIFKDIIEAYMANPELFHCSTCVDKVTTPHKADERAISKQITLFFGINLVVEEIRPLSNNTLNSVYWKDSMPSIYQEFKKYLRHMEKQKEIFKRNYQGMTQEKNIQYLSFMKDMKLVIGKMEKALRYLGAEYQLLKGRPNLKQQLDTASVDRSEELRQERLKLESTTALKGTRSPKKSKKSRYLHKRKPISRFQVIVADKTFKEEEYPTSSITPTKAKKVKRSNFQDFEDHPCTQLEDMILLNGDMHMHGRIGDMGRDDLLDFSEREEPQIKLGLQEERVQDYGIFRMSSNRLDSDEQFSAFDRDPYGEIYRLEDF